MKERSYWSDVPGQAPNCNAGALWGFVRESEEVVRRLVELPLEGEEGITRIQKKKRTEDTLSHCVQGSEGAGARLG